MNDGRAPKLKCKKIKYRHPLIEYILSCVDTYFFQKLNHIK